MQQDLNQIVFSSLYKPKKPSKVELLTNNRCNSSRIIPETGDDVFSVHEKGKKSIITDFEEESQGVIDFSLEQSEEMNEIRNRRSEENDEISEKPEATLRKVKHMQNF